MVALIGAGLQYNKTHEWALQRAEDIGFHLDFVEDIDAIQLLHHTLGGGPLFASGSEPLSNMSFPLLSILLCSLQILLR